MSTRSTEPLAEYTRRSSGRPDDWVVSSSSSNQHVVVVELVAVSDAVAPRCDVDAHLASVLNHPRVLDAVGPARRAEPIELAVGPVVFPAVDDTIAVAVRFDTNGPAVFEVRAQINEAVAIGVVIDSPNRACCVVYRSDAITRACGE